MQISSPSQAARLRSPAAPTVFVIDDDLSIREALISLLDSVDLRSEVFGSGEEFLRHTIPNVVSCLVLDVRLPGLSGLGIQAELAKANIRIPITFMTGYGDIPMAVRAMKAGAIGFLTKPFREQELLDAVVVALEYDRKQRAAQERVSELRSRFETLTPRELEVATWLAAGLMNKQIAAKMGIAEVTVKIHRMQVMRKLNAKCVVDLVRMADSLGISLTGPNDTRQSKNTMFSRRGVQDGPTQVKSVSGLPMFDDRFVA